MSWQAIQKETFQNWVNHKLSGSGLSVANLYTDLKDGLTLHALLETLSKSKFGKINPKPQGRIHMLSNLSISTDYLKENCKLVGIGPEDIHDGNEKLILGAVWTTML